MLSFLIEKESFYESLNRANKMLSKVKSNLFISPGVLLKLRDNNLHIYATDMDSWFIQSMPIYEGTDGQVFIPIKEIISLLKNLKVPSLRIVENESTITLKGDNIKSEYEVNKFNIEEFPDEPKYDIEGGITVDLKEFSKNLDIVKWCAAKDDQRIFLNGVYIHGGNGRLNFVASDGSILGRTSSMKFDGDINIIIPNYMVDIIRTLNEGSALMKVENGNLYINTVYEPVSITLIVRLIDAEYVNYQDYIPTEFVAGISINRDEILYSLERIMPFLPETGEITVEIQGNILRISTISAKGKGFEEMEGQGFGNISLKCMGTHIREIIRKIDDENVDIKISGESTPILISPTGRDDTLFLTVPLV